MTIVNYFIALAVNVKNGTSYPLYHSLRFELLDIKIDFVLFQHFLINVLLCVLKKSVQKEVRENGQVAVLELSAGLL